MTSDIEARAESLRHIYCVLPLMGKGIDMPLERLMNDQVTLVKKAGEVAKKDIKCLVTEGKIQIHDSMLPIEVGDHLLRKLPNGFVEDYVVENPQLHSGLGSIKAFYIVEVRRTDTPAAQPSTVIHQITANFSGPNSRLTVGIDNSINNNPEISTSQVSNFLEEVKMSLHALPEKQRVEIADPIAQLENEIRSGKPDQNKIWNAFQSIKAIAEGATGSLVASGIVTLIGQILVAS